MVSDPEGADTFAPSGASHKRECRSLLILAFADRDLEMSQDKTDNRVAGEEAIIQGFLAPLARGFAGAFGLRDDCALLTPEPGTELVLKTDPVAEGVHFLPDDAPADVAWKALAVNVSDLAAKGATPIGYLMALSFPAAPTADWLAAFAQGLEQAQQQFGCHLMGGDTDRRPGPVTISITVVGSVPRGGMVRRTTARSGDAVFVSGTLGDAALGLLLRRNSHLALTWGLTAANSDHLRRRYLRPTPRLGLGEALRRHSASAMDISDGLAKDLARMCSASGCGAQVRLADLPLSEAAGKALAADPRLVMAIAAGGDDYEVLACVAADKASDFVAAARLAGVDMTRIGTLIDGSDVTFEGGDGVPVSFPSPGWDHF
jgi:thiamine-monophosphate kinase